MEKTEKSKVSDVSFDDYVESYKNEVDDSIGFIGQDVDFFIEIKAELLLKLADKNFRDLSAIKVLDIGSGVGLVDSFLKGKIKNLYGVDVEEGVVEKAKYNNPEVNYSIYNGSKLPFEDNTFDLCFAINVMHHVPPSLWENFLQEMRRVLKPGGLAAVFEHNPLNPLTRLAVARCEFDRDAVLLHHGKIKSLFKTAGLKLFEDKFIVFFPFKAKLFRGIESAIGWLPLGAQHYVTGKKQ
ncbi:MAG: SAM-dependent methyltransferase [Chlorobi bacterium OLB5]|nr:MAG: SAM-dependent methyltransferase [Chlorobi bacterium OLB5]